MERIHWKRSEKRIEFDWGGLWIVRALASWRLLGWVEDLVRLLLSFHNHSTFSLSSIYLVTFIHSSLVTTIDWYHKQLDPFHLFTMSSKGEYRWLWLLSILESLLLSRSSSPSLLADQSLLPSFSFSSFPLYLKLSASSMPNFYWTIGWLVLLQPTKRL